MNVSKLDLRKRIVTIVRLSSQRKLDRPWRSLCIFVMLLCSRISVFLGINPILGLVAMCIDSASLFLISLLIFIVLLLSVKILSAIRDCGCYIISARHYCSVCKCYIGDEGDSVYSL